MQGGRRTALIVGLLALLASGSIALDPFDWRDEGPTPEQEPTLIGTDMPLDADPELRGTRTPDEPATVTLLPGVDLDAVDRDRDLHGIVVDPDGKPVANAQLQVIVRPWGRGQLNTRRYYEVEQGPSTRSAADGTFSIRLEPGAKVDLEVEAQGYPRTQYTKLNAGERRRIQLRAGVRLVVHVETHDGKRIVGSKVTIRPGGGANGAVVESDTITSDAGEAMFVLPGSVALGLWAWHREHGTGWQWNVKLPATGEHRVTLILKETRHVKGRITDAATGKPISGAQVGTGWTMRRPVAAAADGTYAYPWTAAGSSALLAMAPGYVAEYGYPKKQETVDFALQPGVTVTGRVVDESGKPIVGAFVSGRTRALKRNTAEGDSKPSVRSAEDGSFALAGLRGARQGEIAVIASGYGRADRRLDLPAEPGATVDLDAIVLGTAHWIRGVVVDSDGIPQPRVQVYVAGIQSERPPTHRGDPYGWRFGFGEGAFTDDLGRFAFPDFPPGPVKVSARPQGVPEISEQIEIPEDGDATVRLVIPSTRAVEVFVTTTRGKPIEGMNIVVMGSRGQIAWAVTDARGKATLTLTSEARSVGVVFVSEHYNRYHFPKDGNRQIGPQDRVIRFELTECEPTKGIVEDGDGKPVGGVFVHAFRRDGTEIGKRSASKDGKFTVPVPLDEIVDLVVDGEANKTITRPGGQQVNTTIHLPLEGRTNGVRAGAQDVHIRVQRLEANQSLTVTVVDPAGSPLRGVFVNVSWGGPSMKKSGSTDENGVMTFTGLTRQTIHLTAYSSKRLGPGILRTTVRDVRPNGQTVRLQMREGLRVQGRLLDADDRGVEGIDVLVRAEAKRITTARTEREGLFVLFLDPEATPVVTLSATRTRPDGKQEAAVLENVQADSGEVTLRFELVK